MRILFVISSIGIGGEQRVASILTNYFIEKDNSVDIVTFKKDEKGFKYNEKIKVFLLNKGKGITKNLKRISKIRKLIKRGNYDVIIGFAVIPSIICSIANIGMDYPVIVCERNDPDIYPRIWKLIRSIAYKFATGAVFQTTDAKEYFRKDLFKKSIVIPNPIELSKMPELQCVSKRKVIVNTSRLTPAKNHELLIKAFSNIATDFPDYKLEIYGDGPLRNRLIDIINELDLSDRIVLHKATPDVLEKIKNSEIFVLPSNHEGFPNSLAEAMAMGIACISTDCRIGGPKDMIENNKNGLLINVNDTNNLEKALRKLINDNNFREQISKEAYKIKYKLESQKICAMWVEFLNTFIIK